MADISSVRQRQRWDVFSTWFQFVRGRRFGKYEIELPFYTDALSSGGVVTLPNPISSPDCPLSFSSAPMQEPGLWPSPICKSTIHGLSFVMHTQFIQLNADWLESIMSILDRVRILGSDQKKSGLCCTRSAGFNCFEHAHCWFSISAQICAQKISRREVVILGADQRIAASRNENGTILS